MISKLYVKESSRLGNYARMLSTSHPHLPHLPLNFHTPLWRSFEEIEIPDDRYIVVDELEVNLFY